MKLLASQAVLARKNTSSGLRVNETHMSFAATCHECGQHLPAGADSKRKKVLCPRCGALCTVRPALEEDAPPPAARNDRHETAPARPRPDVYRIDDSGEQKCPECSRIVPVESILCPACGYNFQTGRKVEKEYTKLDLEWEAGLPLRRRVVFFLAGQGIAILFGAVGAWLQSSLYLFLIPWLGYTLLLLFLLGTYDRVNLTRNKRGQVQLSKTWRVGFIPLPPQLISLRGYEHVAFGQAQDADMMIWLILIALLPFGVFPAVIWWYVAIHGETYYVALCKNHGYPELMLYRGFRESRARQMAETLQEVTGLLDGRA
jgi:hypothetical protein